jgi:hypothetical protein
MSSIYSSSFFARHSSAFVRFLQSRLYSNHRNGRKNQNMLDEQERRIFFRRLQILQKIKHGEIPHPIFSNFQGLNFSHFANILFARSHVIQKMLTCMQREAAFNYESTTIKRARSLLLAYMGGNMPFVIKLHDDKNKVILLNFRPEGVNVWSCTLTWVDRNKCISCTLESVRMTMVILKDSSVRLNALTFNILLFYTKDLKLRVYSSTDFENQRFFASNVEFYVQRPQVES